MHSLKVKLGWLLATTYVLLAVALVISQGLFGESFVALLLGLPWTLLFTLFNPSGLGGVAIVILLLIPIALNAVLLYWLGRAIGRGFDKLSKHH